MKHNLYSFDRIYLMQEIEERLNGALNKTVAELDTLGLCENVNDRGIVGKVVEQCIFGMKANPMQAPDILSGDRAIEIKAIPIKYRKSGQVHCANAIAVTAVSDDVFAVDTHFENSNLMHKISDLLFVYYEHVTCTAHTMNKVARSRIVDWSFPIMSEGALEQIRKDWELVHNGIIDIQSRYPHAEWGNQYQIFFHQVRSQLCAMELGPRYPHNRWKLKASFVDYHLL